MRNAVLLHVVLLPFRWILAHKCAVFEQIPAFPGVIFCKINTQSLTKGYTHGHLNAHVKSDKTADHRSRPTIKNSVTPFKADLTCSRWSRRVWSSPVNWPWVTCTPPSFGACWQPVYLARHSTCGQMPSAAALGALCCHLLQGDVLFIVRFRRRSADCIFVITSLRRCHWSIAS